MRVFVDISKQLHRLGYDNDWQQCRIKVKNLKNQYKKVKDHNGVTGNGRKVFIYYEQLDRILGHRPASLPTVLVDTASDDTDMSLEENDFLSTLEYDRKISQLWPVFFLHARVVHLQVLRLFWSPRDLCLYTYICFSALEKDHSICTHCIGRMHSLATTSGPARKVGVV